MAPLNSSIVKKAKNYLEKQLALIESQLARLKKDDPFLVEDRTVINEPGTDAAEQESHDRVTVLGHNLKLVLVQIKKAIKRIGTGQYGKCERCGAKIDPARLEVVPEATLCFACEKLVETGPK